MATTQWNVLALPFQYDELNHHQRLVVLVHVLERHWLPEECGLQ